VLTEALIAGQVAGHIPRHKNFRLSANGRLYCKLLAISNDVKTTVWALTEALIVIS